MEYIEDYIREVIPESPEFLRKLEEYAEENHVPIIHPEVAQFMNVLLKIKRPKKILEIGTAIGYSALTMMNAIDGDGEILTIERRDDMIDLAQNNININGYKNKIKILKGEAKEVLPKVKGKFDLIFLDVAKSKYMDFLPYCIESLSPRGIIISDNVLFKGMIANDELVVRRKKTIVRRMREYLDYICNNDMLESSIIPIGDGVALSYKKEE